MLSPHIQVLNERFLSRYGVDRILLLMADHFASLKARVSFGCSRYSRELFASESSIIELPPFDTRIFADVDKFANAEKLATDEMLAAWIQDKPDTIVVGGWPFFDLAARAPSLGVKSVFIDAGAVPHTGYSLPEQMIQQELRRIRAQTLPFISRILPISDFIRYSQTEPDRLSSADVRTVHLGADHLRSRAVKTESALLARLSAMKEAGTKLILAAGRFEPSGYKNSMSAIHVARGLRMSVNNIRVLFLQPAEHMPTPEDMKDCVEGIGFPTDYELLEIIRLADLTLSTSLWEGFNLPLVESQFEGCPTLAYACGSHPEVTADPWFLCQNEVEMASKASQILLGTAPSSALYNLKEAYAERFTWKSTLDKIWSEVDSLTKADFADSKSGRLVFVDVGANLAFSMKEDARSAARALCSHLLFHPELEIIFVQWDEQLARYTLSEEQRFGFLTNPLSLVSCDSRAVSIDRMFMAASRHCVSPPLLLMPMAASQKFVQDRIDWARGIGLVVVRTFYEDSIVKLSSGTLKRSAKLDTGPLVVDAIVCNSASTCEDLRARIEEETPEQCPRLLHIDRTQPLSNGHREPVSITGDVVQILVIEARGSSEGCEMLLDGLVELQKQLSRKTLSVTILPNDISDGHGKSRRGLEGVRSHVAPNRDLLRSLFLDAHLVICPSAEGSIELVGARGLSLGLPCILHDEFLDFHDWGGCYAANMRSSTSMTRAVAALVENEMLFNHLAKEASISPVRDWSDYVAGVAEKLSTL